MKVDILEVRQNRKDSPGEHCEGEGSLDSLGDKQEWTPAFILHHMAQEHLIPKVSFISVYGLEKEEDI